jgi:hypothetical protein
VRPTPSGACSRCSIATGRAASRRTARTENLGGVGRGFVESDNGALLFPPTQYVADGQAMTYRVRWTPVGSDAYEAWSEARSGDGWSTMFRLTLKRAP